MMSLIHTVRSLYRTARAHEIAGRHPARAIARFAHLQVRCRLTGRPLVFPFAGATRLAGKPGVAGANGNYYLGLLELHDMAFVAHYLRPDDYFADVGANVGSYSVLAAGVAGARGMAFEPSTDSLQRLRDNLALNHLEARVEIREKAISANTGRVRFSVGQDSANHIIDAAGGGAFVEVPVSTLDLELPRRPRLIKIDTEGYGGEALLGARDTLGSTEPMAILVELSDRPGGIPLGDTFDLLASHGFEGFAYHALERRLRRLPRGDYGQMGNWLFVRDAEFAAERLRAAPRLRIGTMAEL